jgi:hypothetical protein
MLRLLNFAFNGDIHWFFLLQTSKLAIGFNDFVYQCRSVIENLSDPIGYLHDFTNPYYTALAG